MTNSKAISLTTELPGPKSRALGEERRRWVSKGITDPRHGIYFERGAGARLTDVDGNVFLDMAGGIGCMNAGHSTPRVVEAARAQLERLQHTCFMVAPYEPYVALARKLCEIATPVPGARKAALFNSGAESIENAIKIARRATGRPGVLALEPGFHGRTLLALSLTSKAVPYKDGFGPFAPEIYRIPVPRPGDDAAAIAGLHHFLKANVSLAQIACAVVEPILGEGGFIIPPTAFLLELRRLCREAGTLFIADEVQTGFGRTGRLFASEQLDLLPDLIVLAKSLSGGLPLGAVVGRAEIMDAVPMGALGGTFGGNPVACAAALAAIATIEEDGLLERARALGARTAARFAAWKQKFPFIRDVRGVGAMQAIEIDEDGPARANRIVDQAARGGLLILTAGLYGNVIRSLMPLVMTDAELDEALDVLEAALASS
jgi:4-aminobutyrate aminotransferase/(S)-3-amino-2-methylpropionate transaminase